MKTKRPLVSLVAAGCSKFGRLEGRYAREIFAEAALEAFEQCPNLDPSKDIDALYIGQAYESFEHQANTPAGLASAIGLRNIPAVRVESVSSSGGTAIRQAVFSIMAGVYDVVLVGGVEKMSHRSVGEAIEFIGMAADFPFEQWQGATLPGLNALVARRHMEEYGTREEHLAKVAVKNHRNAFDNPKAQFQKLVSLEEVLSSRVIASPLKLFDCSPISDGAACIIMCRPDVAKRFTDTPVHVLATGEGSDVDFVERQDLTGFAATRIAANEAYRQAGIGPDDLDFVEIHDAFTINEIVGYEDLGLCRRGEGGRLVDEGIVERSGERPVNTSGGLKGKGHPIGATGIAQAYEAYLQLTGQAGKRQVAGAKMGLIHAMGGAGVSVTVQVFGRA